MQPDFCPYCGKPGLTRAYGKDECVYYIENDDDGNPMDAWECLKCMKVFWTEGG